MDTDDLGLLCLLSYPLPRIRELRWISFLYINSKSVQNIDNLKGLAGIGKFYGGLVILFLHFSVDNF